MPTHRRTIFMWNPHDALQMNVLVRISDRHGARDRSADHMDPSMNHTPYMSSWRLPAI